MSVIKSSLEIAMERAASVNVDPNMLFCEKKKREGSRLMADALSDPSVDVASHLRACSDQDARCLLKGILHVLLANLVLPVGLKSLENINSSVRILSSLFPKIESLGQEFTQKMVKYLDEKGSLYENLTPKFSQLLRQKEHHLSQQAGHSVRLKLENLPEFQTAYKEQIYILDTHYQEVVDQTHWHIRQCVLKYKDSSS